MKLYQVDAFTDTAFKGNPAGVYISEKPLSDELMQNLAAEMNLAETAFVYNEHGAYTIRFFTPTIEVPICGHATLSAAHIMYQSQLVPSSKKIEFNAKCGSLSVTKNDTWYTLDFPRYDSIVESLTETFKKDSGIPALELHKSSNGWLIAILKDEVEVQNCKPNLSQIESLGLPPIIITASSETYDYVMRLFAPNFGIPEDPVTGSAECVLAPIWAKKLQKSEFTVKQLSLRTGIKKVKLLGTRVLISGQAVTVFEVILKDH